MHIAYVIVRYGPEVVGGAELGCRMLAEHLVTRSDWSVEVFTTCALDAGTWANHYSPGTQTINGVTVHRFTSAAGRAPDFDAFSGPVLRDPASAPVKDQWRWMELQGPVCPAAVHAAADSTADLVVFYPYLYWPTVHGVPLVRGRAVMHPAAHDEPQLRLPLFQETFAAVEGLVFQTDGERRLAEGVFPAVASTPQLQLGLGVEERQGSTGAFTAAWALQDVPYLLCLGRVDDGKGAQLLARFFTVYKRRRPGPLKLVFAGPVVDRPVEHPDIIVTGPLSEDDKWGALRAATLLVSPSPYEAFSIVLMEAWTAGIPVLVHGGCHATVEHVRRSGGGLSFGGYAGYEVALDRLLVDPELRRSMAAAGNSYVQANFLWDSLMDRYTAFLQRLAVRSRRR